MADKFGLESLGETKTSEVTVDKATLKRFQAINPVQQASAKGIGGDCLYEATPRLIKTSCEKLISGNNNTEIVLGRDRPASRLSGYGGKGFQKCGMIDIVVGRMGYDAAEFKNGKRVWVNPNIEKDAARIYMSQKTDIDKNFKLVEGRVGSPEGVSGIGIKADEIRLISRQGIKLVTKLDAKNSQGASNVNNIVGIDLIAGNDDSDMQPIPKGIRLREALEKLIFQVEKLNGIVDSILMTQMSFNEKLTHHFHYSPFFALPTTPSPTCIAGGIKAMIDHLFQAKRSLIINKSNMVMFKFKYLNPAGAKYFNSRFHNLN